MKKYSIVENGVREVEDKNRHFMECRNRVEPYITIMNTGRSGCEVSFDHASYPSNALLELLKKDEKEINENIIGTLDLMGYFKKNKYHSISCSYSRVTGLSLEDAKFFAEELHCIYAPYYKR